jgi:hypothetical protein
MDEDSLEVLQHKKQQLELFKQDYHDISSLLNDFPKQKSHKAMVNTLTYLLSTTF